jgi:hypothetical protein
LKQKAKAKLLKQKAKAKAKLLKEKEKDKLLKQKAKAKLLKEKAKLLKTHNCKIKQIGGYSDYVSKMIEHHNYLRLFEEEGKDPNYPFYSNRAEEVLVEAEIRKPFYLKVYTDYSTYEDNKIDKLVSSDNNNKFEEFWDNITYLYNETEKKKEEDFKIETEDYEEMRCNVALDTANDNRINSKIFHNCILLDASLTIEICNDINFPILKICEYIISYINKLLNFKTKYNDKYFLQNISVRCEKKGSHRLKLIITPDDEISIIDPGSTSLKYDGGSGVLFDNLYKFYKQLEVMPLHNNKYIVFPQLDSALDIQEMLSVSDTRKGACTIISNLIVHVMVYMRITSKKAVHLISTTIVRKFILGIAVDKFADGYLLFLYNIGFCKLKNTPLINNVDVKNDIADFFKSDVGDLKMIGDSLFDGIYNKIHRTFIPIKSPIRIPLNKLPTLSPIIRLPTNEDPSSNQFLNIFKNIRLRWKRGTTFNLKPDSVENKTPIYYTESGLMPFKTLCPIVQIKSKTEETPFECIENLIITNENIMLLEEEINMIAQHKANIFISEYIYIKIGEFLIVKYGLDKLLSYLKLSDDFFKSDLWLE